MEMIFLFKVDKIVNNTVYLKGVDIRLYADSSKEDLILSSISKKTILKKIRELDIKDFFLYSRNDITFRC
ncbi:MAG: hypothetical protein L6V81_07925 [Clostridium sp.]|nr:MAG: hypothetical protein L6V81_07925 [Clostridium sp.]